MTAKGILTSNHELCLEKPNFRSIGISLESWLIIWKSYLKRLHSYVVWLTAKINDLNPKCFDRCKFEEILIKDRNIVIVKLLRTTIHINTDTKTAISMCKTMKFNNYQIFIAITSKDHFSPHFISRTAWTIM